MIRLGLLILLVACSPSSGKKQSKNLPAKTEIAYFAGGCFWCMEAPFEKFAGVISAESGYQGGKKKNPTYDEVSGGATRHREAVRITFDPTKISYQDLLQIFWRQINPTDDGGQFVDRGFQYTSAIYTANAQQKKEAEESKRMLLKEKRFKKPIVTPILPATPFYLAEEYHQDFYKKSPVRYKSYRYGSGRDKYLDKVWGKERDYKPGKPKAKAVSRDALRKKLTKLQYYVTQEDGTEPPFKNKYWDNKKPGIYVDVVSGEPLFSSTHKFKSGTGWPSFTQPLEKANIVEHKDTSLGMVRIEVRSKGADSHLGHVFDDGPAPTGLRYCINSAAMKFIPLADLARNGLGKYQKLFKNVK